MEKVSLEELLTKDIKGKIICFPTDTVYGVGAKCDDIKAVDKIYEMKKRDYSKPLAILTSSKDIKKYVDSISTDAVKLMDEGWPGALTLIFKKSKLVSDKITCGLSTVAFRMPNSKVALTILDHFGPLATTSVNISGMAPLNDISDIENNFSDYIDYLVTDKEKVDGKPSIIIDVSGESIKVIRE